jgi:ribulose-phosphate 3-epimerase
MKLPLLAPSLLSADFSQAGSALSLIKEKHGSLVHIDVMDGTFVPEISYGEPVVRSLRPHSDLPFDVHLMVEHPETHIESFAEAGADFITFHAENTVHQHRIVQHIHSLGKKAGIAIVPSTPVDALAEILPYVDLVLVMSVNPGFGGQSIIPRCIEKITALKDIRTARGYAYQISVDGGITEKTAQSVIDAGADIVVSGSAFFSGKLNWGAL